MIRTYTTKAGDVLDAIVAEVYGRTDGVVEKVLEHNRPMSLADRGPIYPAGLVIELPEIGDPAQQPVKLIRLWE